MIGVAIRAGKTVERNKLLTEGIRPNADQKWIRELVWKYVPPRVKQDWSPIHLGRKVEEVVQDIVQSIVESTEIAYLDHGPIYHKPGGDVTANVLIPNPPQSS